MKTCNKEIDFSVILLKYNQADILPLQIEAIKNQNFPGKIELIITDDGSKLRRQKISSSLLTGIDTKFVWQPDMGFRANKARNNGISLASGKFLIFFDGDIIPAKNVLLQHWQKHLQKNHPTVVTGLRLWRESNFDIHQVDIFEFWKNLENQQYHNPVLDKRELKENTFRKLTYKKQPWRSSIGAHFSIPNQGITFDPKIESWGPDDLELFCRLFYIEKFNFEFLTKCYVYQIDKDQECNNFFRKGSASQIQIKNYLTGMLYFYHKYKKYGIKAVLESISRLKLNQETNKWEIKAKKNNKPITEKDLANIGSWLEKN